MASQKNQREHLANISESVTGVIDNVARCLMYIGGFAALLAIALLIFTLVSASSMEPTRILGNVELAARPALWGLLAVSLGVAWLMWGEEIAGPILVIIGLALLFLPAYAGFAVNEDVMNRAADVVRALSAAGGPPVMVGLLMIAGDLAQRIRLRISQGARAELMKYGQGVREERDVKNIFLGKCWQLPYCRKFVRERCPIYHSKRTCWKERVGCMCEEQVIRNAMADVTISKDSILAAKRIPKNNTLTLQQKKARCASCIIYNEHQKHKYRALLPATILGVVMVGVVFFTPGSVAIQTGLRGFTTKVSEVTTTSQANNQVPVDDNQKSDLNVNTDVTGIDGKIPYAAIIYSTCVLVGLAYSVRFVEYLIFKHKI
jgi:hypothetical protein